MKYIQEFLEINIDDLDQNDSEKLLFLSIGILSEIILETKYYSHNKDLKIFINEILTQNYKDYLFDARPTLYARIIKDLRKLKLKDPELFNGVEKNIQNFIASDPDIVIIQPSKIKKNAGNQNKSNPKVIDGWRAIIDSER